MSIKKKQVEQEVMVCDFCGEDIAVEVFNTRFKKGDKMKEKPYHFHQSCEHELIQKEVEKLK